MRPPCFDIKTKTDCPDRKVGCAVTCERWAEYVEARDEDYRHRKDLSEIGASLKESYYTNRDEYLRRQTRMRARRFKRRGR